MYLFFILQYSLFILQEFSYGFSQGSDSRTFLISKNINLGFSPHSSYSIFQMKGLFFPLGLPKLFHAE